MHEDGTAIAASPLRLTYQAEGAAPERESIRNFKSTLLLAATGRPAETQTVAVNRPLKFNGYTLYQTGYNPEDLSWTALEVVRDPGVPLVYGGFALLIGGLFVVFYLNPWLTAREAIA
jgi:cytochrome c biogenesis protein ResB